MSIAGNLAQMDAADFPTHRNKILKDKFDGRD
jgi:hypothetical protein